MDSILLTIDSILSTLAPHKHRKLTDYGIRLRHD